uniref:SSD domain-containing protein n=1 Tax=Panagrolaimus sp. ES5 TaxID=591445 RepID=A0AC34FC42_9BILA
MKIHPPDLINSFSDDLSSHFSTTSEGETVFIRGIHRFYRALGRFVARNAWAVIVVCMAITIIGAIKTKHTPKKSDLSGYAPYGARSRYELAAYEQFFDYQGQGIKILVMLMATDNGTMIRNTHLNEAVNVIDFISKNFTIYNSREQRPEGFDEYCYGFCLYNEPIRQFYNGYQIQTLNPTSRINLSYPVTSMFGRTFSLQPNFFGIKTYSNEELTEFHAKNKTILTNMKEAKMILLQFRGEREESWTDEQIKAYEIAISEYFINEYKNPYLKVLVVSNSFAQKEIQRGGLKLQPFLAVGFVIMTIFTVITELISSAFAHQCSWYKVINAVTACIVPFCSVGAAFGMLFFAGFRFGPIILVTPFLILAIGVDDSFLMMHAWQRVVSKLRKHPRPDDSIEYRIAEVLAEAGPSITISALTNIMAFIVGGLTSPPEVELFCYANAFALFVDTVFSVTLYAAIMALCGKQEMKSENQTISIFIIILLIGYLALTTYGTLNIGIDLSTRKFFLKDSILLEADVYRSKYVIPNFTPAAIIVNNPGNLSDPHRIEQLNNFIQQFEKMNNSIGSDATKYFLRDYEEYKDPFGDLPAGIKPFDANDLEDFLSWPEYSFWKGFLKVKNGKNGEKVLDKFFVNVGFEGKELVNWEERGRLLKTWRDEVDKYRDIFNATIYSDDALFLDLIKVIPSVSWQSAAATKKREKDIKNVTLKGVRFFEDFENPKKPNVVALA